MRCRLIISGIDLLREALTGEHWDLIDNPALELLMAEDSWMQMIEAIEQLGIGEGQGQKGRNLHRALDELLVLMESGRLRIVTADVYQKQETKAQEYVAEDFEWPTGALAITVNVPIFSRLPDIYDRSIPVWPVERVRRELEDLVRPPMLPPGQVVEVEGDPAGDTLSRILSGASDDNSPYENLMAGFLQHRRGDLEAARNSYDKVIASGHPDATPRARRNLALIMERMSELDKACEEYRAVVASEHPDESVRARVNLGWLLDRRGDRQAARGEYEAAISSAHSRYAHTARVNLAALLMRQGDLTGAEAHLRAALSAGRQDAFPRALRYLGLLFERRGSFNDARDAYEQVIRSGDPKQAAKAQKSLDALRPRLGRLGKPEDAAYAVSAWPPQVPVEEAIARHQEGLEDASVVWQLAMDAELYGIGRRVVAPRLALADPQQVGRQVDDVTDETLFELSVIPAGFSGEQQAVALFTRDELARAALLRPGMLLHRGRRSVSVLKFPGRVILDFVAQPSLQGTTIIINPATQLEFQGEPPSK